ncbi:uncharacterized protein N7483_012454 [Penicillium malachiteum]|uniref:uncharacterized protein n=1 Tax=Penicillium malachiteum TaxID=1324776 RepID=UPI0025488785|nr:uncharacterized protein N7483_012454 [Penicillium malachiteum]KAJ5715273.1 hypothetical protein N7483_012454 [Penicillium malachiteum]
MSDNLAFDELPLRIDGPRGNAWGLFGGKDECGMLNFLTPERINAAAKEIQHGIRIPTDLPLDYMSNPCFGRSAFHQNIKNKAPRSVNDDTLQFNTQISSQWDGFRHYGYQDAKLYFNGHTLEDLLSTKVNGIHAWVENGGIVGRGVLLDYASWAEENNIIVDHFSTHAISATTLQTIAAERKTELKRGDIVFIRSGWTKAFSSLSEAQAVALAEHSSPPAVGIESSEETLRWLWDGGFAAIAGDMPSMEAWPCQDTEFWLHEWLLAGWGMPIGELFDLERLSAECKRLGRWSFFFSSVPLRVPGGVASPP